MFSLRGRGTGVIGAPALDGEGAAVVLHEGLLTVGDDGATSRRWLALFGRLDRVGKCICHRKLISLPVHRSQVEGSLRVGLNLLPNLGDVPVNCAERDGGILRPESVAQLFARDHTSRAGGEVRQEPVLKGRERETGPAAKSGFRGGIQG